MANAKGSFEVTAWGEEQLEELDGGGKVTRAWGGQTYRGDIQGEGAVQWLMWYRADGSAHFVGVWRITAGLRDRAGSFVLESSGDFDGGASNGTLTVIAGSGTGALSGLRGTGTFRAPGGPTASYELEYDFD
jgi:Protein of unknown function (DUF3224)